MTWRSLGIAMIIPTLAIAIIIAWRTRGFMSEACHNLAIVVWITANSYWMISEFFGFDENIMFSGITWKYLAIVPFVIGILILAYYYIIWRPANPEKAVTM